MYKYYKSNSVKQEEKNLQNEKMKYFNQKKYLNLNFKVYRDFLLINSDINHI